MRRDGGRPPVGWCVTIACSLAIAAWAPLAPAAPPTAKGAPKPPAAAANRPNKPAPPKVPPKGPPAKPGSGSRPPGGATPPSPPANQEVTVEIRTAVLRGGVQLVVAPSPSAPLLAVAVVEGAGFSSDPAGRGGLSALTARLGSAASAERRSRLVGERGGRSELEVGPDDVVATYLVPPGELELVLWLEGDRLAARPTEPALVDALRALSEDRSARPFERHREKLDALVFQGFLPYAHAPDGAADELIAIRRDLLAGALAMRPRRPVALVVSGPIGFDEVAASARRHLDAIPAAPNQASEAGGHPEQTNQRAATATDGKAAAPAIAMAFAVPAGDAANDGLALDLAAALLALGNGSRVGRSSIFEGQVETARATFERRRGPSVFRLEAHLTAAADPVLVRERLERAITDLGKAAPRPEELSRAANALALEEARTLDDPTEVAAQLGRRALGGALASPAIWNLGRWRGIDGASVSRAASSHLSPIRRNVLEIRPDHPVAPPVAPPPAPNARPEGAGASPGARATPKGTAAKPVGKPRPRPPTGKSPDSPPVKSAPASRPAAKPAKKRGAP